MQTAEQELMKSTQSECQQSRKTVDSDSVRLFTKKLMTTLCLHQPFCQEKNTLQALMLEFLVYGNCVL